MICLPALERPVGGLVGDPAGLKRMFRASAMVTETAILVLVAALVGGWVDRHLGTATLLLLLSSCTALVVGLYRINRWLGTKADGNHPP